MTEDARTALIVQTATTIYVALLTHPNYSASPPDKQLARAMKRALEIVESAESGGVPPVKPEEQEAAPTTAPTPSPGIPQPPRRVSIAEAIAAGPAPLPDQPVIVNPPPHVPLQPPPPAPHVHETDEAA